MRTATDAGLRPAPLPEECTSYARDRLGYPNALIGRIGSAVGLERSDAVIDPGAGPGQIAIPFAREGNGGDGC